MGGGMILKPNEICKFKEKCPYLKIGDTKCVGVVKGRGNNFECTLIEDTGEFKVWGESYTRLFFKDNRVKKGN